MSVPRGCSVYCDPNKPKCEIKCPDANGDVATPDQLNQCVNNGMIVFGPSKLGYYDGSNEDDKKDAYSIVTSACNNSVSKGPAVVSYWAPIDRWLQNTKEWTDVNPNIKRCTIDYLRSMDHSNHGIYSTDIDIAFKNCSKCTNYWKTGSTDPQDCNDPNKLPPVPLNFPFQPLRKWDPSGFETLTAIPGPSQPSTTPLHPPDVPDIHVTPETEVKDEIVADLSELFLTPEWLTGVGLIAIPLYQYTSTRTTITFVTVGILGPYFWWRIRLTFQWIRDTLKSISGDNFKLIEYPAMTALIGSSATAGLIYTEKYLGYPELISDTFLIGVTVTIGSVAIALLSQTTIGKDLGKLSGWLFKGVDYISKL